MSSNIFNSIFGDLNAQPDYKNTQKLKDRMKTTILKAKKGSIDDFVKTLASDYIRISREL